MNSSTMFISKINFFYIKTVFFTLIISSVGLSLTPLPCFAQRESGFPLVSLEIRIVPEQAVCKLRDGYNTIVTDGIDCPPLDFKNDVLPLRGLRIKTKPTPPNEQVSVGDLFDLLGAYREEFKKTGGNLSFGQRKSAIFIFDFGEISHQGFDISIDANQKGKGCQGQEIPENKWSYSSYLPANFPNSFYHVRADAIIPCANVTWQLTAKEKISNQTYTWIFKTTP